MEAADRRSREDAWSRPGADAIPQPGRCVAVQHEAADRACIRFALGRANERVEPARCRTGVVVQRDEVLAAGERSCEVEPARGAKVHLRLHDADAGGLHA
jgi:hypothetical protein